MNSLNEAFWAVLIISALLLAGKLVRLRVRIFQTLYLPSSIIAGAIALLLGPEVIGRIARMVAGQEGILANGFFPQPTLDVWSQMPGLLISVVFASLFLGKSIAPPREIWRDAGPMVVHGQIIAWGQYVIGLLLVLLVLEPVWNMNPLAGALIEISFEGGHGTAAGLAETFRELGFESGADLALGLATIGVVAGVLIGTLLVNWAVRRGHLQPPGTTSLDEQEQLAEHEERESIEAQERADAQMIDPLSVHLGYIAVAIGLGWLLHNGMMFVERLTWVPMGGPELLRHIPLFPLAMIGGVILQIVLERTGRAKRIDRKLINRVSGASLDLLIVSALATISLATLGKYVGPFLVLALAGIAWNVLAFFVLAPRLFKEHWVPYGLANFGQCMGMTVIGLLLIRMSDPGNRTGAMHSFGYKQLLFEPIVGGGLFTAASLPLIAQFGPVAVLVLTAIVMLAWLIFGLVKFGK
ncbi:MAG: sodium:glutamate symporter [Planctomycetaceae bacterium]|nr:MAG: sodium:glutamate symporter [Planctomycetaceae bacterium]